MLKNTARTSIWFLAATVILAAGQTVMAQVSVQFGCNEIAVIGAVTKPGRLAFRQDLRLLDALTDTGGLTRSAGKVVRVVQRCDCSPCTSEMKIAGSKEYVLFDVLQGKESANPLLGAGELVIVPEAEMIFVVGNVLRQQRLVFREGMTLTQAVALVGGPAKASDQVRIRIHRRFLPGQPKGPNDLSLKAAANDPGEDPQLRPSDIIEISDEDGRFLLMKPSYPLYDPPLLPRNSPNCE